MQRNSCRCRGVNSFEPVSSATIAKKKNKTNKNVYNLLETVSSQQTFTEGDIRQTFEETEYQQSKIQGTL